MTKPTLASLSLLGAIVGVGIFGVPYALSKVGWFLAAFYLVALTGIQLLQHLFYAEAGLASERKRWFVGLAEHYLGARARLPAAASIVLGSWAGMLAYIVVGGSFLHLLLSPLLGGEVFWYQLAWGVAGLAILYFDPAAVTEFDAFATIGLIIAVAVILVLSLPHVVVANYAPWTGHDLLLPYGVILFSLSGLPAVLEMRHIIGDDRHAYRRSVVAGTLGAAVITGLFGFVVWGVTGSGTSEAAIGGLQTEIGPFIGILGAIFGFLAVATSHFASAINLKETFHVDYHLSNVRAWLVAGGVPLLAFLLGANQFVAVISFSGAIFGGMAAVIVALMYVVVVKKNLLKGKKLGAPLWTAYLSIALLTLGALGEAGTVLAQWLR